MKKILALVLVLGIAQLASAAMISYNVPGAVEKDGEMTLVMDTTYTLELVLAADAGENVSSFNTSLKAAGSLADIAVGEVNAKFQNGLWNRGTVRTGDVVVWDTKGSTVLTGPYGEDGDVLATLTFTTGGVGELTFDDYAGAGLIGPPIPYSTKVSAVNKDMVAATFQVIPEPMTMSLLGLGGLALIRRRRNA